jgi:hypothetical protein
VREDIPGTCTRIADREGTAWARTAGSHRDLKYCDNLPLYRQSGILAREGVEIDRTTMAEWMGHVTWWLRPLAALISDYVMAQSVIWTDDTPIRTLAPGTGKTRLSRFWCYAIDPRPYQGPGYPAVLYRYSPDRKGERPRSHLDGFNGYLHTDAFVGYQALYRANGRNAPRITHVACMAHARRKLFEVFENTKSPIAEEALRRIQELYAIEADIKGPTADQRWMERQTRSKPLLNAFHVWAIAQRRRLSGKTPLGKALQYGLSRWDALDPLYRGRPAQHRQQFGGATAEGYRCHAQEFSVPRFR